ncbi:MAG: tripartite tricarboxylate transporter TctB family protein [Rhizobiales bacterium]|nr:tripartite tricarboxylate transporter TctB family protein [Hyphomicrobiales bacterium]
MLRIRSPQDLGAGLVFIAIGVAGVYFGQDLTYGSSSRMGPGYFPIILSYLTIMMGLIIGGRGFALDGPPIQRIPLRPISFVILAILAFGFLIEQIGLALTTVAVIFIASAARKQFNVKETVVLAIVVAALCVGVFIYGLSQPMPAWWGR